MQENKRKSGVADLTTWAEQGRENERRREARRQHAGALRRRQLYKTVVLFRVRREKILKIQKKRGVPYEWQLLLAGGSSRCPRALKEDGAWWKPAGYLLAALFCCLSGQLSVLFLSKLHCLLVVVQLDPISEIIFNHARTICIVLFTVKSIEISVFQAGP